MTFEKFIASCRSKYTKDLYSRGLKDFCEDPDLFVEQAKKNRRKTEDSIIDAVNELKKTNRPTSIRTKLAVLKSFLLFEEVIKYQSNKDITYGDQKYVLYLTNRRIIAINKKVFPF